MGSAERASLGERRALDLAPGRGGFHARIDFRIHTEQFASFVDNLLLDPICTGLLCTPGEDKTRCLQCDNGASRRSCWDCESLSLTVDILFQPIEQTFSNGECKL